VPTHRGREYTHVVGSACAQDGELICLILPQADTPAMALYLAKVSRRHPQASGLLEPMREAAAMVNRHLEGILGHWKAGLTTAFLEGLNSLFSATKRKARGYRSSEYLIAMLYLVAGKLEIPSY